MKTQTILVLTFANMMVGAIVVFVTAFLLGLWWGWTWGRYGSVVAWGGGSVQRA